MLQKLINIITSIILIFSNFVFSQNFKSNEMIADSSITITFSAVGDIMCHSTQFNYARMDDSTFNFQPVFREIKKYFDNSDVIIGNLETVVAGKDLKYSGYPVFNTPDDFLKGLKYAGFDFLITGNNHTYDHRKRGVVSTIDFIHQYGMKNSGTYKSKEERDSVEIFEVSGLRFALLSYTYGVNLYKISEKDGYLVNRIDPELIKHDIDKAKSQNADLIIVYFHFGSEYARSENRYQKNAVEKAISFGADIIIGAHPHTLQPIEIYKTVDANIDSGFVAYSLGNFVSNQRWRYSDGAAVLNFSVEKKILTNEIKLNAIRYLPFWVFKGVTNIGLEYVVLPLDSTVTASYSPYLTEKDKMAMQQCFNDTRRLLESRTSRIEMDSIEKSAFRKWKKEQQKFRAFIAGIPFKQIINNTFAVKSDSLEYLPTTN